MADRFAPFPPDPFGPDPLDAADDALARRLAAPLRVAERPDDGFREGVMAAVRAEAAGRPARPDRARSWWRRPRGFALSPVGGLALAAGFAGVVVLAHEALRPLGGSRVVTAAGPGPEPATVAAAVAAAPDTVHVVRFVLVDGAARAVTLVGDFNGWDRRATRLVRAAAGRPGDSAVWTVTVALPPGRHEYAFVVDGRRWVTDSAAPAVEDEFGTRSSVVTLDAPTRPTVGRSL